MTSMGLCCDEGSKQFVSERRLFLQQLLYLSYAHRSAQSERRQNRLQLKKILKRRRTYCLPVAAVACARQEANNGKPGRATAAFAREQIDALPVPSPEVKRGPPNPVSAKSHVCCLLRPRSNELNAVVPPPRAQSDEGKL